MFPAFQSPAYARFWTGALISNIGTWMHQTALGWLVYSLTDSAFWLGATSFVGMSPSLLLSLHGGVIADRADRARLLVATQITLMTSAFVLAALTASGVVTLPHILMLSLVSGTALAFTTPVYQTVLHEVAPPAHLMNAISLHSVQFNLARIIGPIGAGVTTATVGMAGCFVVNGVSFLALIVAILSLQLTARESRRSHSIWNDLRAGLGYAWATPMIRTALSLATALSLFGFPYIILMPAFARDILHLDVQGYAFLLVAPGAGAVLGGLALATFGNVRRKGVLATVAAVIFSLNLIGFAFSSTPAVAALFLFFVGLTMVGSISTINTVLQLTTEPQLRGRVMSMLALALFGLSPLGSLHIGIWAEYVGTQHALAAGGCVCFLISILVLLRARHFRSAVHTAVLVAE
jgi:MFS family permease